MKISLQNRQFNETSHLWIITDYSNAFTVQVKSPYINVSQFPQKYEAAWLFSTLIIIRNVS